MTAATGVERLGRVASLTPVMACHLVRAKVTVSLVSMTIRGILLVCGRVILLSVAVGSVHTALVVVFVTALPADVVTIRAILDRA